MKAILLCLALAWLPAAAFPQAAADAEAALLQRADVDEIRWSDPARGSALKAGVVRATDAGLEVQRGTFKRVLAYSEVSSVKFGLTMGERQLINQAAVEAIPALRVYWEARKRTIAMPESNAGEFGLALARALRKSSSIDEAQSIASEIAQRDNHPDRRSRAKALGDALDFLSVMETAPAGDVEKRAWAITETADESNPDLMLLVTGFLMRSEFAALLEVEKENPRWMEDDEIKPQRDRHYHLALDLALYPSLFHPLRESEAAEGLWQAVQVYQHTHETPRAVAVLEDLLALYGDSAQAEPSRALLATLQSKIPKPSQPAESEKAEAATDIKAPPPPPKRYNLFED